MQIESKQIKSNIEQKDDGDQCIFCMDPESTKEEVITPCNHSFHLDCLKKIVRPFCPICKSDISEFLKENGITEKEMKKRIKEDNERITTQLEELIYDEANREEGDEGDEIFNNFMDKIMESFEGSDNWHNVYADIILDMIGNARHLFAQISEIKQIQRNNKNKNKNKNNSTGLFKYTFRVSEFWGNILFNKKSEAEWVYLNDLKKTPFYNLAKKICSQIQNKESDFGVMIVFIDDMTEVSSGEDSEDSENSDESNSQCTCKHEARFHARMLSTDVNTIIDYIDNFKGNDYISGIKKTRTAEKDIIQSLLMCESIRSRGPSPRDQNKEYMWSKKYLKYLKRKLQIKN